MVLLGQQIDFDPFAMVATAVAVTGMRDINHTPVHNQELLKRMLSPCSFLSSRTINPFLYGTLKV